ncbi:MAG: glycosyltransferase [Betaproteobacteria bacterium]|nr:glycosyltransferase [Betaproteobacteria bacterium]
MGNRPEGRSPDLQNLKLHVSPLWERSNREKTGMLLTVFEQLWAQGHSIRLVILGRPNPDCHTLLQRLKHHPEQGKRLLTVFDGADQELEYVYSHCRALILPSLAEGFGLPLVEARTRGCTVIANDLPSFLELADEGVIFYKENSQEELVNLLVKFTEEEQYRSESICMPPFLAGQCSAAHPENRLSFRLT